MGCGICRISVVFRRSKNGIFLSADSISSALLVGLREEGGGGGGGGRRIIFKFIDRIGRIEGLGVLILSQCLAVAWPLLSRCLAVA